jgi:deoxyribodipyrimidine photo-lyase
MADLPDVFTTYRKSLEPLSERPRLPLPKPTLLPPPPARLPAAPHATFREPSTLSSLLSTLLGPLPAADMGLTHPPRRPSDPLSLASHSARERTLDGGETAAQARLHAILARGIISGYAETRNGLLGDDFSTRLSGHLVLGCITARRVHAQVALFEAGLIDDAPATAAPGGGSQLVHQWRAAAGFGAGEGAGGRALRCQLLWCDYMRLCARKSGPKLFAIEGPRGVTVPDKVWRRIDDAGGADSGTTGSGGKPRRPPGGAAVLLSAAAVLRRWLEGRTGAGLIDASQRELFLTGFTSSRARPNVASFLAKHLRLDWRIGAEWYECMLVDYDAASCWANWAYAAGVGNDPREDRIFNPVKQALEYDPRGKYITTWVPELQTTIGSEEAGPEGMMGVFQAWRLDEMVKGRLNLRGLEWVNNPLVRIDFNVAKKPRSSNSRYYGHRARKRHPDGNAAKQVGS